MKTEEEKHEDLSKILRQNQIVDANFGGCSEKGGITSPTVPQAQPESLGEPGPDRQTSLAGPKPNPGISAQRWTGLCLSTAAG